jgi:hypothetical protein
MNRKEIETWYAREAKAAGETSQQISRTPFRQKLLTFSLLTSVPVLLTGCADEPAQFTAEEECEWEEERNAVDYDCDDVNSGWYFKKGYKSKGALVPITSPIYQSKTGIGSGGKRSGGFFGGG